MKIKYSFQSYDPRGRTMTLTEGDSVPIGWFVKDWDSEVPVLVTEESIVVGETVDRTNPCSGVQEVFRTLSVRKSAPVAIAVAVPVMGIPPQALSAMAEITAAGGTSEFAPAITHARGSHCRQWAVSGEINGLAIRFSAFSTGVHRWNCVAGSQSTMADTLAMMPVHTIKQAEVEAKSAACKALIIALGSGGSTDTSGWNSLDWQAQVERDNDKW